jgi:predicted Zn-dependent protease
VGANLAAQLPGGWTYQFYLIKEDEERETHEPTAFPGGHIFVSQELVMEALNEEEFAGMLAHAMAHVAEPHRKQLDAQQGPVTRLGILYVRADFGALSAFDSQVRPMALLKVLSVVERKADTGAVQAMAAAGYDPAGLWSYLEGIRPVRRSGQMSKMFATLPPVEERVAAIKKQILGLPARTYQPGYEFTRLQAEFKSATIKKPDTAPTLIRKTTPDLSH